MSLKRATTPLRVPQILGGQAHGKDRDTLMEKSAIAQKNDSFIKGAPSVSLTCSCHSKAIHLIDTLTEHCMRDICTRKSTGTGLTDLQFQHMPIQLGCPGYLLIRPGYYRMCHIYHVDFLYRMAVIFVKGEVLIVPLTSIRMNSYANLNSIFRDVFYEATKSSMASDELEIYKSSISTDPLKEPIKIPWRSTYLLPVTFDEQLFKQNPILTDCVCPHENLLNLVKALVKKECEQFKLSKLSQKRSTIQIDFISIEREFIDELKCSITGLVNLQSDQFAITNSCFIDIMVPSIYVSKNLLTFRIPEVSEESSEMVIQYDLQDAEMHSLSSLYKFVIAKSIIGDALTTGRLELCHQFDHMTLYFRLSLNSTENSRPFLNSAYAALDGVELFYSPPCYSARFQNLHNNLLLCSKFDPSLVSLRDRVMKVVDSALNLLTPLPDKILDVEGDAFLEIPQLIVSTLFREFPIDKEIYESIKADLQFLLQQNLITFPSVSSTSALQKSARNLLPSDSTTNTQSADTLLPKSLEIFLSQHLSVISNEKVASPEYDSLLMKPFFTLLPVCNVSERYYLARAYFLEKVVPLLLSSTIVSLLRSKLLTYIDKNITPACISDSTFSDDFSKKIKELQFQSIKAVSETKSDRYNHIISSGLPLSVINNALSIMKNEGRELSSGALLIRAFNHTWPRFFRTLIEQIKAHITNVFLQMHETWSNKLLNSLTKVTNSIYFDTNSLSCSSYIFEKSEPTAIQIGAQSQYVSAINCSWLQKKLFELSFSSYATDYSIFSIDSLILVPKLSFSDTSPDKAAIHCISVPNGNLKTWTRSLLFSEKHNFEVPTIPCICKALVCNVKKIARTESDDLAFSIIQDLLLLNEDQEIGQFFSSWFTPKENQFNVLGAPGSTTTNSIPQLPPLYPTSKIETHISSINVTNVCHSSEDANQVFVKEAENSSTTLLMVIVPSNDEILIKRKIESLFETVSMKIIELLSLYNNFNNLHEAFEFIANTRITQDRLLYNTDMDSFSYVYSAPPECMLKMQISSETPADEAQNTEIGQILNPYTSVVEDNAKAPPDLVCSLSTIETVAIAYINAVLEGKSSKKTIASLVNSSAIDQLVLTVHIATELVRVIDQQILDIYIIPSYASVDAITIVFVDFKLSIISAFIAMRQIIYNSISKTIESASSYMLRVMQATESMLGMETLNLDKLSQILIVMEDHNMFVKQWSPIACYLCNFLYPISKLYHGYPPSTLYNIQKSIAYTIPIIYGSLDFLDQKNSKLNCSKIDSILSTLHSQSELNKTHTLGLADISPLQHNELHIALQATIRLGWVNHAYKNARFNYKRHIRVFSRLLLVFSDWLSKIASSLREISCEVLKMQLSDFQLAVTNPLQFRKAFPAFSNGVEIPYLETMYSNFEGNDLLLVSELIKTLQAYTCIHISINSQVVNGFPSGDIQVMTKESQPPNTDSISAHHSSLNLSHAIFETSSQNDMHHTAWQIPYKGYRWPYFYSRPSPDHIGEYKYSNNIKSDSVLSRDYLLVTAYNFESAERCDLFVLRNRNGLISASSYINGHLCDNTSQEILACQQTLPHYDILWMFMELYVLIEEIKNLYLRASSWSKALNIDMHLIDTPTEIEDLLLPPCLLITSFVKLSQLYNAASSKALIDIDAGVLITLLEICATSISTIRSSFVYSNWIGTAEQIEGYMRGINAKIFLLYLLASPDAIEEDLANFGEVTGLNTFLRSMKTSQAFPPATTDAYFESDRSILVENIFLYNDIDAMFEAAATIYAKGLINQQAMVTLSKIDNWINDLRFQPVTLSISHKSEHILSALYDFWENNEKEEFSDRLIASKLGPVMGGKGVSLTSILQKTRTIMVAKEKVLEVYSQGLETSNQILGDSLLGSPMSNYLCESEDTSIDEDIGNNDDVFTMKTLDQNKKLFDGSITLEHDTMPQGRAQSTSGNFDYAAKQTRQHGTLSAKGPLSGIPTIICSKRHLEYIREAIFVVAYVLFNDYSPSIQTIARRLEVELILLQALAISVHRAITIIPELLLLLPDLCSIAAGTAHPRLKDAFPTSHDPLLEVVSLLNIMRQLNSFCTEPLRENACNLPSKGVQRDSRYDNGEVTSLKGSYMQSTLLSATEAFGTLRTIIRHCPYIIRSLSLHIAQADNILRVFSNSILRLPLVPVFTEYFSLEYARIPRILSVYYAQGQHYIIDLIRRCPLIRNMILYNNSCTSTSALLPSGKLKPIVFHTSNNAFSNSVYDIMIFRTGTGSLSRVQITGICSGYEQLRFSKQIDIPDTLLAFSASIFSPVVHRAAMIKEYSKAIHLLLEKQYTSLIESCIYQCTHYALSTLVFMHLDGSPSNFLQLYYKCIPEFKMAVATVAIKTGTIVTDKSLSSCYSLRNYKQDRRVYIQALLARINEYERILHSIMEDSLTLYVLRTIPNLSRAATVEKVASFMSDEQQVRAIFIELYEDFKGQACTIAISCGIHPSAHIHHLISTFPYGLPTGSVFTEASSKDVDIQNPEPCVNHTKYNTDFISQKNHDGLFVSCAEVAVPIIGHYTGKASLLDCIPLNYKQLQAISRLGISMKNRIPAFLVGDMLRSYNNIDYLIIVHSLCRYFGMRYEFIFCSPATETDILINNLCTKILAGCYIVLCGVEFLGEKQLNGLSNILSSYNLATGSIQTLEREDKGQSSFSLLQSTDKGNPFWGGYAICLPEAVYEGSKFSLTVKGEKLRKLFPIHNLIEIKDYGTVVPTSLIQQTKSLLYDLCLEARGSTDQNDVCIHDGLDTEKQVSEFFADKNLSKEYHSAVSGEIQINALKFDVLYPHCNHNNHENTNNTNPLGYLFMQKSSQYGSKLYEISMFLNTMGLSTPQLRLDDISLVFKRCKDVTNPISVATSLTAYLLSQTVLLPVRNIVSRIIEGAFTLQPQNKAVLNSVVSLLNVLHGVQEPDETDIGVLISRKANSNTDTNLVANNIVKVWKTLKQMYTPLHAEFCENMSKKSAILEPVGVDALTLCLEMLTLGPVFLLPPATSALQSIRGVKLTTSQLSNKNITPRLVKSGALYNITLRQSHFQLLIIFSQLIARIGKLRPFFIHSLADLHENIRTIMYLGSQALLIFVFNPPNGEMARSMLSAVTALQSYYPEIELSNNIKAKFDFFNKPRCLLLAAIYDNAYVINSNLASIQRRLIVIPEYLKFSAMLNNYIGKHLHLTEDKRLTEQARKMFTVTSLLDMKTPALSMQYLQSLCSRRTVAEFKGECLAEKRLRLGSKMFGVLISCLTDEMMRKVFNIVPSPTVWTLYRQLLVLFLTCFKIITLSPCHPEAYATFESITEVKRAQTYQVDSYLSLHTITSSTPLANYDTNMQVQNAPRAMFFNASFSISYLQNFIYEATDNVAVIINLFLPVYAAVFNTLHTMYIMHFRKPLNKLGRIYKRGLAAFIYRPERFVSRILSTLTDSTQIFSQTDLDSAMKLLPDLFPENYADEEDTLSAYSYLGVSDSNGSFIYFSAADKGKKLFIRHFPYTCSSGIFIDTSFENLFSEHVALKHELILTFDCERILFVIYLSGFIMAKLSVCLIGETFSGKSTYIKAAETFLNDYVCREHIALSDTDSFDSILKKLMKKCYLHNIQTGHPTQIKNDVDEIANEHADSAQTNSGMYHPLSSRKEAAGACSVIGCPLSILNVVEDNTLLDEAKDINYSIVMDVPSSKLPLYHLTVTNLLTNTATHNVPDNVLNTKDTTEEMSSSMLESLVVCVNNTNSQSIVQKDKLSTFLGEKYIIMDGNEGSSVCSLTGIVGARFSAGIFAPNVSIVLETSYLHDFLLSSEINFVCPPMNNTRDFLLLLLKRNFQHPSISELNSFAPKIVQAHIAVTTQPSTKSAQPQKKCDCNLYIGVKQPEKEFLHEFSDFYFMQFIEGLLLVEYHLPVSILRVLYEIKKLKKYINSIDLSNIQMNILSFGSLMGALRNIPAITSNQISRILDELASAVAMGRLAPHGPYGSLNPENMTKYLRANTLITMSIYSGVQAFPNWEIQILNAAFKKSTYNKGLSALNTPNTSNYLDNISTGVQKVTSNSSANTHQLHCSDTTNTSNDSDKYKNLVTACEKARKSYSKLFFYNPHDNCVNHKVFEVHSSAMNDYLLGVIDPTICNRVFTFIIDVSTLMEYNSLKIFHYIKYLRNPGLFAKLRSPTDAKSMQTLALQVPVFLLSQIEMPGTFYSSLLHVIQVIGAYKISNKKTFVKIAKQAFSAETDDFDTGIDSHDNSFSCSVSATSAPKTISTRSLSEYNSPLLSHTIKNSDLRAFLSIIEEPTEIAIKRRQRILIDTQTMIQSLVNQTVDDGESESDTELGQDASKNQSSQSKPVTTTTPAAATIEDFITELTEALVSVISAQSEVVASHYIIRAAVLIALGINPLIAFKDFTPTSSTHICDSCLSIIPDYLLKYINKGSLEINAHEYTDLFLSTPTDIMVTIPMSLFNALFNKDPALGILSIVEAGSSTLALFTSGEVSVLGALLARYFGLTTMLSGKEIINILSRSFSLIIFADTSINHPLPLQELPIVRHTIDENEKINFLNAGGGENIFQTLYQASGTAMPSLHLIRSIPYFILSKIPYYFDSKYFIIRHEQSETPLHDMYSDMYREIFCRTTLFIYNACVQNVSDSIPYSLTRFSEVATYYTNEIIKKYMKILTLIQKILSSITLLDNGIRNGLFSPTIRNNFIYLRDQLVSVKLKLKLDFVHAVMMLQNACCDGPLIAARLLFYPFTMSVWGNCRQFELGLFECLKNRKITNTSLNTSYSDNSTVMLQSLFNLSTSEELIQRSSMLSNYGLPSRLLMICEDLMLPKWKTQLICSLCNPDPKLIQEIIIIIQYIKHGFKFLFVTDDLARIIIPACEVYLLEASLEDYKERLTAMGVDIDQTLKRYNSTGVMITILDKATQEAHDMHTENNRDDMVGESERNVARQKEMRYLLSELERIMKKINELKHSTASYKKLPSNVRFGAPSTCYNYRDVHKKLLVYIDCHLPVHIFEAILKHALLQDKPLVFLNFGSTAMPPPNMIIMMKLALLIGSRMTKKNVKVSVTTTYSIDIVRPLHDYRIYYVIAPGSSFKYLLEIGFVNLRNCDISVLNAPKFQFKSNSLNLLKMQDPSITEYELRYKIQEISEKFSSIYSLYVNGFNGLEIIRRESCLEGSDRLYKYIESVADILERYVLSRKEVMQRLIKREESNSVFVHIQQASKDGDGLDFDKLNFYCTGIERSVEYREEIAKKITDNSVVSVYAEYFGTAITSILLLLRQMSLIHPNMVTVFTDHFFECHLSYLDERVESNPSRAFTVIVNTAHYILENTILLLPQTERGLYVILFMSLYNLCFKLGRQDDLMHLKVILANDLGFFISHFSDRFNNHLPLYNRARQIASNCPTSFRCSPNLVYSWRLFSLISIYNPQRFVDWYEYFIRNKAVFTLLNFAGDAYKVIIGTYLYKEKAAQSNDKGKHAEQGPEGADRTTPATATATNIVDLHSSAAQEFENSMGNMNMTNFSVVPLYVHDELATYSTRMAPLPPSLQYPSFENIWAALLLIVSLRQDLIVNTMEFFCKITPPSAIYKFLQDNTSFHAKLKTEWCSTKNEVEMQTSDIFSRIVFATTVAIDNTDSISNIYNTMSNSQTSDIANLQVEGGQPQKKAVDSTGATNGFIDFSTINPANMDHVTHLFEHFQDKYSIEATQQTSLGRGSRVVLLYHDEGLAILPFLRTVFEKELKPKYGFLNYVCQPAPAAECFSTSVVIVDTRYNPCYSLSHLIALYNSGVRPAYLMYILVALSYSQKFGTESGAMTTHNVGLQLATFIEVCRPMHVYIQRPTTFLDAMQHSISIMRSYKQYRPAISSVYESSFMKAFTLLAIRHSVLLSNRMLRVDDNELLLLYTHLVSQMKTLPHANQGRLLFFAKKQESSTHTASIPMMYSILFHLFSDITIPNTLSNIYSSIYYRSSNIIIGSPMKTSTSVAISYLNSRSLNVASFYGDTEIDTRVQAAVEQDFDPSFSSISNNETEFSNSKSVFSSAESSLDDISMCSYRTEHTHIDVNHMDGAQQVTNHRIMDLVGDDIGINVLLNNTGPDRFKSYSKAELQRFLNGRRRLATIHASSRMDSLLRFPEIMSESSLIDLMDKIRLIAADLEKFATKHTNVVEIMRTQELQARLADTLQPIRLLRPVLSRCQSMARDAFSLMLSHDILFNLSSQHMNNNVYSTVEVDRSEKALPSTFYAILLLSKTYQRVNKLTYGFTLSSCVEQSCPIKVLSGDIWTVRGDIYQPIMHDILKFFKLHMCLKYNMEMEYHSIVFTILDPTYYKDWFLRYDSQNRVRCSKIDHKKHKRKCNMPLAAIKITNMRLYGIGYDFILNTVVDLSPESLSYPNSCDIYAILIPCEIPSSLIPTGSVKIKDSYTLIHETLSYSSSPSQHEEECEDDELAEIDQDFGVDYYYENSIQHVMIPVDFPGCWYLILQNKTSLKESDINAKSPYCGTGYF